jgi:hypothetical protein
MLRVMSRAVQQEPVDAALTSTIVTAIGRAAQNALLQIGGDFVDLTGPATFGRRRITSAERTRLARAGVDDGQLEIGRRRQVWYPKWHANIRFSYADGYQGLKPTPSAASRTALPTFSRLPAASHLVARTNSNTATRSSRFDNDQHNRAVLIRIVRRKGTAPQAINAGGQANSMKSVKSVKMYPPLLFLLVSEVSEVSENGEKI